MLASTTSDVRPAALLTGLTPNNGCAFHAVRLAGLRVRLRDVRRALRARVLRAVGAVPRRRDMPALPVRSGCPAVPVQHLLAVRREHPDPVLAGAAAVGLVPDADLEAVPHTDVSSRLV